MSLPVSLGRIISEIMIQASRACDKAEEAQSLRLAIKSGESAWLSAVAQ